MAKKSKLKANHNTESAETISADKKVSEASKPLAKEHSAALLDLAKDQTIAKQAIVNARQTITIAERDLAMAEARFERVVKHIGPMYFPESSNFAVTQDLAQIVDVDAMNAEAAKNAEKAKPAGEKFN